MSLLTWQLASWPNEETVVAEILLDGVDIGHVVLREGRLSVTFYRNRDEHLAVDLDGLQEISEEIQRRLR